MEYPLVSIFCLSYNHEKYIEQALNSIINQDYPNFEIVYIDNCSADKTFEIGEKLLAISGRKYIAHKMESNIGIPRAVNYALKNLIKSEYVSLMSLDDWLETNSLSARMNYLNDHPECGMVYSHGQFYYEDKNKYSPIDGDFFKEGRVFNDLLKGNFVYQMGVVIPMSVYRKVGYYDEHLTIEDWDFALRVAKLYPIGLVRKPLYFYRRHSSNYSIGSKRYFQDSFSILKKYKSEENYEIGYEHIRKAYFDFLTKSEPQFGSLFSMIGNCHFSKEETKQLYIFFKKIIKRKIFRK